MENIKITVPMMEANGGDVSLAPVVAYSRDGDFWRSFMFVPRHVAKGNLKKIYQATCVPNMGGGPGRSFANPMTVRKVDGGFLFEQSGGLDI